MRILFALAALALAAPAIAAPPEAVTPLARDSGGHIFADCLAAAVKAHSYERYGKRYLRFVCSGETARGFYEAMVDFARERKTEVEAGGRMYRFTEAGEGGPEGRDHCWYDASVAANAFGCQLIFPAGPFLDESLAGD